MFSLRIWLSFLLTALLLRLDAGAAGRLQLLTSELEVSETESVSEVMPPPTANHPQAPIFVYDAKTASVKPVNCMRKLVCSCTQQMCTVKYICRTKE